jgi:hypothetical protein
VGAIREIRVIRGSNRFPFLQGILQFALRFQLTLQAKRGA